MSDGFRRLTQFSVAKLLTYLRERGVTCSCYKKDELVRLAGYAEALGLPAIEPDDSGKSLKTRCRPTATIPSPGNYQIIHVAAKNLFIYHLRKVESATQEQPFLTRTLMRQGT